MDRGREAGREERRQALNGRLRNPNFVRGSGNRRRSLSTGVTQREDHRRCCQMVALGSIWHWASSW